MDETEVYFNDEIAKRLQPHGIPPGAFTLEGSEGLTVYTLVVDGLEVGQIESGTYDDEDDEYDEDEPTFWMCHSPDYPGVSTWEVAADYLADCVLEAKRKKPS